MKKHEDTPTSWKSYQILDVVPIGCVGGVLEDLLHEVYGTVHDNVTRYFPNLENPGESRTHVSVSLLLS